MTIMFSRRTTCFRKSLQFLYSFAVLLIVSSIAFAQPRTGTIKTLKIKSAVLGEERTVLVRTPVGYESNKIRYPVLYMTDGDPHINHTASTIEFLTQNGRIPELIVVGVTNTDRTRDLTPVKSTQKPEIHRPGKLETPAFKPRAT